MSDARQLTDAALERLNALIEEGYSFEEALTRATQAAEWESTTGEVPLPDNDEILAAFDKRLRRLGAGILQATEDTRRSSVVGALTQQLVKAFSAWCDADPTGAVRFEWTASHLGQDYLELAAFACGFEEVSLARGGGFAWGRQTFNERGEIDLMPALRRLDEAAKQVDIIDASLRSGFELATLQQLHRAAKDATKTEAFATLNSRRPFRFLLKEHDQDPVLFYVHR